MKAATGGGSPYWAKMREGVAQRLREARESLGLTQRAFCSNTEIPLPSLKDYEGGKSIPGGDALARYGFCGINVNWLLTGDGDMHASRVSGDLRVEEPRPGYVYLPLYDVRASAGGGRFVDSERVIDSLAFKEDWIRHELRARPGDLKLIYVEGDSMEPDLRAGDIVLLDHTDTRAGREGVYVIRMDGALLVKQLQRLPGGVVKVISRNQAYEPFTVTVADIEEPNGFAVIGRVVWACRRF